MNKPKSNADKARAQAKKRRDKEAKDRAAERAAFLESVKLKPKGTAKQIKKQKGSKKDLPDEDRRLRNTINRLFNRVKGFFKKADNTPKPESHRAHVTILKDRKAAKRAKAAGNEVIKTKQGYAVIAGPGEHVSPDGQIKQRIAGRVAKRFKLSASALTPDEEDGETPLAKHLQALFTKLKPGERVAFQFTANGDHVSSLVPFDHWEDMYFYLMRYSDLFGGEKGGSRRRNHDGSIENDKLGYLVVIPYDSAERLQKKTTQEKKERAAMKAREARKKRPKMHELTKREQETRRRQEKMKRDRRRAKGKLNGH